MIDILPYYCKRCGRQLNSEIDNMNDYLCNLCKLEDVSPYMYREIVHPKVTLDISNLEEMKFYDKT